jgi:hypothetical protein
MYSKVHMCKYLSHMIHIQNGLQRMCFITTSFNLALQYATRRLKNTRKDRYWQGHVLLIYGDAATLLGEYINTTKDTEAVLHKHKEVYLQINVEKFT